MKGTREARKKVRSPQREHYMLALHVEDVRDCVILDASIEQRDQKDKAIRVAVEIQNTS